MDQIAVGKIRSIEIGEPKQGFTWTVGNPAAKEGPMSKHNIAEIVRDDNNFFLFGFVRYLVLVDDEKKERRIFREYNSNHKITITYDINT